MRTPIERFMAKVQKTEGCWFWTGRCDPCGYGKFRVDGKSPGAHRWSYLTFVGPIPDGLTLDHLCHNRDASCVKGNACPHRKCVNPDHLELTSSSENTLRGRTPAALNARKTRCPQGHPYDEANTYVDSAGRRHCRACMDAARRRYRARQRAGGGSVSTIRYQSRWAAAADQVMAVVERFWRVYVGRRRCSDCGRPARSVPNRRYSKHGLACRWFTFPRLSRCGGSLVRAGES